MTALLVAENLQTKCSRRDTEGREEEEEELSLPTHGKAFAWEQGPGLLTGRLSPSEGKRVLLTGLPQLPFPE